MKILLIGPQGSGKSTQGKLLAKNLNIPYISTGDIFREIASKDSEEGERIKQILEQGKLVDDETVVRLIRERIQSDDCKGGFILDGYPRTLEQAKSIEDLNFDKAFYFKIPEEVVVERLLKRGREDDTKELIEKRLVLYFQQIEPLLNFYKNQDISNKGILAEIDGVGAIEKIQEEIRGSLSK